MTANRKKAPEYLKDDHLSVGTKEYLKVLNSGDKPVESLSVPEARKVLVTAQASVKTDLSGIEESEKNNHSGRSHAPSEYPPSSRF